MALSIVRTSEEALVGGAVVRALREGVADRGSAVLLVPTFAQALDAQKAMAGMDGLSMGVTATTPAAWTRDLMQVWGDGRTLADDVVLSVLARQTIVSATKDKLGPMPLSAGLVRLLSELANRALPWLPLDETGEPQVRRCADMGLTTTETKLLGLVGALGRSLSAHGYATRAQASVLVPDAMARADARVPAVVVAGFSDLDRRDRELVRAVGALSLVTVVLAARDEAAESLAAELAGTQVVERGAPESADVRDRALDELVRALFTGRTCTLPTEGPVEELLAAGPVAEAELVAERVVSLAEDSREGAAVGLVPVVVATPDVDRALRELVPKLAARGVSVRVQQMRALRDTTSAQAFFSFARTVASLSELAASWPEPEPGLEGPVPRLGDMSWWPPRELVDFLLSDLSSMAPARAWRLDASWRGNRLLTPAAVLQTLQSERDTSVPVARATAELLRGRVGSAAAKLLGPYLQEGREIPDEARATLQAALRISGTLHELGVSADPSVADAIPLSELVRLCEWAAQGMSMVGRHATGEDDAQVLIMDVREASLLEPCTARTLVLMGCTTEEQPIAMGESLLQALLEQTGVEPEADPMAKARASFLSLMRVPTDRLVLERALHNADGKETYPSVMLGELLGTIDQGAEGVAIPQARRSETMLSCNRSASGAPSGRVTHDEPAAAGQLTDRSRAYVFVPPEGTDRLPDGLPVLSASQVETYLECPYKWFSLRRLRLGRTDAGHGGAEMGSFAHRVLERTHGELLARALGADVPERDEAALRELGERHLVGHIPGSRVTDENLADARAVLDLEFDLHQQHMRMVRRPKGNQQLLVPHNAYERAQEDLLREDLLSCLEYEKNILQGFEPRLFEWSFGRRDELVPYAGAYFTGTVDRIDVSPHGTAVIIDYKHKGATGFASEYDALQDGVLEGVRLPNRVQSLIYAQVVRRAFEGRLRLVGTLYLCTKAPHALAGAADENVADLVFGPLRANRAERVCVPGAGDGRGMEDLLDRTEELVAEQVSQMLAGNVEARPRDWRSCSYCPVMQCEKRVMR